jgi:hypothetical protein
MRCPWRTPKPFVGLVSALTGDLDANYRVTGIHDRAYDAFDRIGQRRHAVPNRTSQMILHRDAAYLGEALVDLQVATVGREASEADRRHIVDQLQGGLLRKQHDGRRFHRRRPAI